MKVKFLKKKGKVVDVELEGFEFDGTTVYVVGRDTLGDGLIFDEEVYACFDEADLNNELLRMVDIVEDHGIDCNSDLFIPSIFVAKILDVDMSVEKKKK